MSTTFYRNLKLRKANPHRLVITISGLQTIFRYDFVDDVYLHFLLQLFVESIVAFMGNVPNLMSVNVAKDFMDQAATEVCKVCIVTIIA